MPLNIIGQLFIDGAWTTKPAYSERGGWDLQVGPDSETTHRPNKIGITWASDDLEMDPSNVMSPLYGKIGRNTRVRLRIAGQTLTFAEASSWQPETTVDHQVTGPGAGSPRGVSWVGMTAEGLLRRLGKWTDTIQSPLRRYLNGAPNQLGYLPLEDPSGAARLEQAVSRGAPGRYRGSVTLGEDGPLGSNGAVRLGTSGVIEHDLRNTTGNSWTVSFCYKLAATPTTNTMMPLVTIVDSGVRRWDVVVNNTNFGLEVQTALGASLVSASGLYGTDPRLWTWVILKVTPSGGNVNWELYTYRQNDTQFLYQNGSFASASGTLRPIKMFAEQNMHITDACFAHWLAQAGSSSYPTDGLNLFNSYPNEKAGDRFSRLLNEQGLQPYVIGAGETMPMGPQRPGTLLELITECVNTDGGLVYDEPLDIALTMRGRASMSSVTPLFTLTKSQISYPFKKIIDDSGIANQVTVSNADGSKAVASLDDGPISTLVPPNGIGLVKYDLDTNMADVDRLGDRATYELAKRTVDRPRYQQLKIDLLANSSLTGTVNQLRPGDWIAVTGVEPDTIYLRVISWQRSGDTVRDEIMLTCLPAEPMQVAVIDRADALITSSSTTLNAGYSATATTLVLTTVVPQDAWSTAGDYDLTIAGERIGVPAGGMGAVVGSGNGPFLQTITGAVRSKNGVVKAQLAGAKVDVFQPVRVGL